MTNIDISMLAQVTGGEGNSFSPETAFKALSNAYASGDNPSVSGGVGDNNDYEMRLGGGNGPSIVCTRNVARKPTFRCNTKE